MTPETFITFLHRLGVRLRVDGDGSLIAEHGGLLTSQDRTMLVEHRGAILAILRDEVVA